MTMIQHVRKYALWGIPCFPVHWPQDDGARCSCKLGAECQNIGKHPLTKNGVDDATTDLAELEAVWERYPHANIGLATGHVMDVLDLDDDDEAIKYLQDEVGLFCEDDPPIVQTGRGQHVWYRPIGSGNRAGILPGVDWRGKGGYVLAPPSLHKSGRRYEMHGGPFDRMPLPPHALCDLVLRQGKYAPVKEKVAAGSVVDRLDLPSYNSTGLVEEMESAPEGKRNSILYWAFRCVLRDAAEGRCDAGQAQAATTDLMRAAEAAGLTRKEILNTFASAKKGHAES